MRASVTKIGPGCERCAGADPAAAWEAQNAQRLRAFVEESHFSIRASACDCGQRFVIVFTERIDWQGGEDDQTWLSVHVSADELAALEQCSEQKIESELTAMVAGRRFLVRSFPTGGSLRCWWRDSGFAIGPHD